MIDRDALGDHPPHRGADHVGALDPEGVEQADRVGGPWASRYGASAAPPATARTSGWPCAASTVERPASRLSKRITKRWAAALAQLLGPVDHLRPQPHDQQDGGIPRIAEGLVDELELANAGAPFPCLHLRHRLARCNVAQPRGQPDDRARGAGERDAPARRRRRGPDRRRAGDGVDHGRRARGRDRPLAASNPLPGRRGATVLAQLPGDDAGAVRPSASRPLPVRLAGPAPPTLYAPFGFTVGSRQVEQFPSGIWQGNLSSVTVGGTVYGARGVLSAQRGRSGGRARALDLDPSGRRLVARSARARRRRCA